MVARERISEKIRDAEKDLAQSRNRGRKKHVCFKQSLDQAWRESLEYDLSQQFVDPGPYSVCKQQR